MANYLDANPEIAETVAMWRADGDLVPHLRHGKIYGTADPAAIHLPVPLPAEDYVIGLELLGFRLSVAELIEGHPSILTEEPTEDLPPAWDEYASRIMGAFKPSKRQRLAIAFLRERDGR